MVSRETNCAFFGGRKSSAGLIRFTAIILCIVLSFSFVSCGGVKYSKEEIKAVLDELLPLSFELNEIYFGEGLPISDNREDVERFYSTFESDITSINYHPVSSSCKYQSEADIKSATEKVFTKEYSEFLYQRAFNGVSAVFDEGTEKQITTTASYARYIESSGVLMVRLNIIYEAMELGREYNTDELEIVRAKNNYVVVKIPTEFNGEKLDVNLTLVNTENGFRIDTPTY